LAEILLSHTAESFPQFCRYFAEITDKMAQRQSRSLIFATIFAYPVSNPLGMTIYN